MELAANLDSMSPGELTEYARAMDTLAEYARTKAQAMQYRAKGDVMALLPESRCNELYDSLPAWAKSW
jgi:hypothetical protein